MWRDEIGIMEMLLSYIGEFNEFDCWSNWRPVLIDILSSHEEVRQQRIKKACEIIQESETGGADNQDIELKKFLEDKEFKEVPVPLPTCNTDLPIQGEDPFECSFSENEETLEPLWTQTSLCESNPEQIKTESIVIKEEEDEKLDELMDGILEEVPSTSDHQDRVANIKTESETSSDLNQQFPTALGKTDDKPLFSCNICGSAFARRGNLKIHLQGHTEERPFVCFSCGRSFKRRGHLKSHILTHSGERPFPCNECGKSFTRHSDLKRHRLTHMNNENNSQDDGKIILMQ